MQVNRRLWPIKAHYFLFNAGTAPVVPYMTVYAKQLGLSSLVVGTIYSFLPVFGMIAKPLFGAIADKFRIQKTVFLAAQLFVIVFFFVIQYIPEAQVANIEFDCSEGETFLQVRKSIDACSLDANGFWDVPELNVNCQVTCAVQSEKDWKSICDYWHVPTLCVNPGINPKPLNTYDLKFNVALKTSDVLFDHDTINMKVNRVYFDDNKPRVVCPLNGNVSSHIAMNCSGSCDTALLNELISQNDLDSDDPFGMYQLWLFFACLIISWCGMAVVFSIGDAICFEMLGEQVNLYGHQRMFGALGFGIFSFVTGYLIDWISVGKSDKDYTIIFYIMLIFMSLDFLMSQKLDVKQTNLSSNLLSDLRVVLIDFPTAVFLFWCIIVGLNTALVWNFLFWLLEDLSDCSTKSNLKTLQGLVNLVQSFGGEIPFYFLSGKMLKKIGPVNCMHLVLVAYVARFILYAYLTNPWWCLPIELLQGATIGISYATMASYANTLAPPGLEATMQGLVGAVNEGIGVSLGSFIGGLLFKKYKGPTTFFIYGIATCIFLIIHWILQRFLIRRRSYPMNEYGMARYTTPGEYLDHVFDDTQELQLYSSSNLIE